MTEGVVVVVHDFDALNLNLIMSLYLTPLFTSLIFLQSRAAQLVQGTYLSTRFMHDKCNLYDELALRGVTIWS